MPIVAYMDEVSVRLAVHCFLHEAISVKEFLKLFPDRQLEIARKAFACFTPAEVKLLNEFLIWSANIDGHRDR